MNENKNILVTGGAGYIGSVLCGQLLQSDYNVRVIDNLSFGGRSLLGFWNHPRFQFIKGDISDKDDIDNVIDGISAIIHLAAIVGDPACKQQPELATKVNKTGAELLCETAVNKKVQRFIFASTCSNYGKMNDPEGVVNEEAELNPVSLYAELKVGFEKFLLGQNQNGFTPVCLRFSTAFGLSPRPRFDLTVNEFTKQLYFKRDLEIYGEQFWRPYCHTVDLSRACIKALEADCAVIGGQAYNVGDNDANYQKKMLIDLILKELPDSKDCVRYVHRDEDPRDYRVNFDKIRKDLQYTVSKKVEDGIVEYIHALQSGVITDPDNELYKNI